MEQEGFDSGVESTGRGRARQNGVGQPTKPEDQDKSRTGKQAMHLLLRRQNRTCWTGAADYDQLDQLCRHSTKDASRLEAHPYFHTQSPTSPQSNIQQKSPSSSKSSNSAKSLSSMSAPCGVAAGTLRGSSAPTTRRSISCHCIVLQQTRTLVTAEGRSARTANEKRNTDTKIRNRCLASFRENLTEPTFGHKVPTTQ